MSGRGGRREAARFWRFFCGKRAAFSYVFLLCVLFMGGGTVSLASQAGLKPGTEGGEAAGLTAWIPAVLMKWMREMRTGRILTCPPMKAT